jgi:hypothetical protein
MAVQSFSIVFTGYWREPYKGSLPSASGIYCVYRCQNDPLANSLLLNRIVYIGGADDAKAQISAHEKLPEWSGHLQQGEELCYSFAEVEPEVRARCEAALVFQHRPPANTEYTRSFPFDQTTMALSGKIELLTRNFTVRRTPWNHPGVSA